MKRPSVKKILVKAFAYFSCAAFIATKAQAQTIKVADFTTARATYTAGSSYNLNGTLNVNALAKLTNTTNFGTSGTVAHPLSITQAFGTSGSVTVAGLNSYDILFICYLSAALTTAEQNAIYTWSQQPGKVVICAEQQGFSPYSTLSGYALANGSLNPTLPISTGDNLFHLFSGGVFGTAGSDGILQAGTAQGYFSADCYATVIAQDANHHTGVLFNAKTRDLYFADGGYFTTQTSTGMSSGGSITTSTDKVWANTWAWAINEVLTAPTNPTSVITAQTTVGCTAGSTGALTFISPLGTNTLGEAYTYSIDGTNYQSSPTFSNLAAKTYTIYAKSNSCTVSSGSAVITVDPAATPTVTSVVQPTCTLGTGTVNLSGLPATGNWSIARTGTSTATLTGSGSTTANSGVAPGTYSYTVTNSDGCSSSSSSSAILTLPTGYSSAPNLIANTLSKVLTQPTCADVNGYIQFVDPSSTSTKYMAINPNGNTGYNFTVTALNNNPTIANQKKTDGLLNTTALANRMYTVTDAGTGSYATNGGMVVRIYYASGDSTAARSALDASIATGTYSGKWFKLAGTASNVLSAQTATGITGAVYPAATYGAENGVDYVEFSNITSFSTFGFIEKRGAFVLPVGIKTFTALANNCNADLAWETSTEQNSSSYDIEASTDGANFSKVGEVKSKNIATGASYTYSGYKLTSGVNYFRLKAIDFDGQFSYSQTVSITNGCLANGNVSIFPNPAINVLTIKNILPGSNISLYNSDGKKLMDMIATASAQNMNIAGFASGVYVLHTLSANGTVTNTKVIKQ